MPWLGSILLALILGVVVGNTILKSGVLDTGLKFAEKRVLEFAIVLIGFGFDNQSLSGLTPQLVLCIVGSVSAVLLISVLLGKVFNISSDLALLLGVGNAICGSAAIAATAPIVKANEREIGLSLGVINLLGLIGLAALPILSYALELSDFDAGVLIGGTLQSVGHVAASSFAMNEAVGEWAMVVKMGRVFLLVPLLLIMFFFGQKRETDNIGKFPLFILFFIAAVSISNTELLSSTALGFLDSVGDFSLAVAMAAIGVGIKIQPLLKVSLNGIWFGATLFGIQILIVGSLVFVLQYVG